MSDRELFSTSGSKRQGISGEIVTTADTASVVKQVSNVDISDLPFYKRWEVMRDAAESKAEHFKEMAKLVHEYQQRDFRNQLDAKLQSRGKQILADTAVGDADVNRRLAIEDEKEKEFFEEYIFSFKTKRVLKYNERMAKVDAMLASSEITEDQAKEIKDQMTTLRHDIDTSFIKGINDIMRRNLELRDKIIGSKD